MRRAPPPRIRKGWGSRATVRYSVASLSAMATANGHKSQNCTVCLDSFKDPKVLPCCHTFCKACLDQVLEKSPTKGKLSCPRPQCRGEHDVPANGVDGFLTDFTVTSDLEVASALDLSEQKPPCGECDSGDPSVAYCCDCQTYLCEYCSGGHKRMKRLRDHKVLPLDSLTPDVLKRSRGDPSCRKHLDKSLVAFCKTCQALVCNDCIVTTHHEGHKYSAVDTATREEVETKLKTELDRSKAKLTDLREGLGYIKRVEQQLGAQPDELKKAINATFDSLVATLETRRAQLLKETDAKCSGDLKKVWSQREVVEIAVVDLETTVGFTERVLECASDAEFLSLSPQAFTRLSHLETTKWEVDTVCDLEETKREFLGRNHRTYVQNHHTYLQNIGEMREVKVSPPVVLHGLPKSLPLAKKTEFTPASKSRWRMRIGKPAVTVSYGFSRKKQYLRPVKKAGGKWVIPFTPVCGGRHSLSLSVSGKEVEESPFEFTVQGTPAEGDIVTRGPDWKYGNVDGGVGSHGIVGPDSQGIHNLAVTWNNGNEYLFRWGTENGQYDIVLVVPGT